MRSRGGGGMGNVKSSCDEPAIQPHDYNHNNDNNSVRCLLMSLILFVLYIYYTLCLKGPYLRALLMALHM